MTDPPAPSTAILVLAAGASRRMRGRDKLLEPLRGEPLLRATVRKARATGCPVLVALPHAGHPRAACLAGLGATVVPVPGADEGMAASLRAGVAALPPADRVMVMLADMPDITTRDLAVLIAAARDGTDGTLVWRGAGADGRPGHPIVFHASLRPRFAALQGDTGGAPILAACRDAVRLVRLPGTHALCDLDTPEDWAAWRAANPV